jgi:hypothetical protein
LFHGDPCLDSGPELETEAMSRRWATVCAMVTAVSIPVAAAAESAGADPESVAPQQGSRHVVALLQPALPGVLECLAQSPAPVEEALAEVLVRLEFRAPGGQAPSVVALDAWPGSAVDRCVRGALARVITPSFAGPDQRHECLVPLTPEGLLRCRPAGAARAERPPRARPAPPPTPRPAPQARPAERARPNSVTINPLGIVFGGVDIKYTRYLRHSSVGAAIALMMPVMLDELGAMGLIEVLGWPGDRPSGGLYAGAALEVGGLFDLQTVLVVGALAVVGHRWLLPRGLTLGIGGALGYAAFFSECARCNVGTVRGEIRLDADGRGGALAARLSLDVGFAF